MKNTNYYRFQEAISLSKSGKDQEALKIFQEILKEEPDDYSLRYQYAFVLSKIKHYDEALIVVEKLYQDQKQEEVNGFVIKPALKYLYGHTLARCKKYDEATSILKELIKTDRQDSAYFELGKISALKGDYDNAKYYFRTLLKKDNRRAKFELAKLELMAGNIQFAKTCFQDLIDRFNDSFAIFELAKLELMVGEHSNAFKHFSLLAYQKGDLYAKLELGKLNVALQNYADARTIFEEIKYIKNKKGELVENSYALLELAKLEAILGHDEKAISLYLKLIRQNDTKAKFAYAQFLESRGKIEEAKALLIDLSQKDVYSQMELARLELRLGNTDLATDNLKKIVREHHINYIYYDLGLISLEQGLLGEARKYLGRALKTINRLYAKFALAKLEFIAGNYEITKQYLEELLETKLASYAKYELGKIYFYFNNDPKAFAYFKSLESEETNFTNNNYCQLYLARIYARSNDLTKAKNYYTSLLNTPLEELATYELSKITDSNLNSLKENKFLKLDLLNKTIQEHNYPEALNILEDCKALLDNSDYKNYLTFIKFELNTLTYEEYKHPSYFARQVVHYNPLLAKEHISKTGLFALEDQTENFTKDSNLDYLLTTIPSFLKEENLIQTGLEDIYFLNLDPYLLDVITVGNTKNVIEIRKHTKNLKTYNYRDDVLNKIRGRGV